MTFKVYLSLWCWCFDSF